MEPSGKLPAPDLSPAESKRWIGRLLIAVVLGIASWNFVASLTSSVILPGLSRIMEADAQSPLYLGKGDINFAAIFASTLELCLALIVALIVNAWAQSRPKVVRRKNMAAAPASLSIAAVPVREAVNQTPRPVVMSAPPAMGQAVVAEAPKPVAAPVSPPVPAQKAAKPKNPKEIYYNLVGEPVDPDE